MYIDKKGYLRIAVPNRGSIAQHILIAEAVLGKLLPKGVEVHHVDGIRSNNANSNLVICPNAKYHKLLHTRTLALNACGNPNYRKCNYCHQWDDPINMVIFGNERFKHRACWNIYMRNVNKRQYLRARGYNEQTSNEKCTRN